MSRRREKQGDGSGGPQRISGEKARGGEIILRTRRRRTIFIAGLAAIVLLVVLIRFASAG